MTRYEDDVVRVDEGGVTIKHSTVPGRTRTIGFDDIRDAQLIDLKAGTGRYRLVGISPGRPRTFFYWDRNRRSKGQAVVLDTGRWLKRAITPHDPDAVLRLIRLAR
jgi:hypothetical protein